jgi:hypothetical protein
MYDKRLFCPKLRKRLSDFERVFFAYLRKRLSKKSISL